MATMTYAQLLHVAQTAQTHLMNHGWPLMRQSSWHCRLASVVVSMGPSLGRGVVVSVAVAVVVVPVVHCGGPDVDSAKSCGYEGNQIGHEAPSIDGSLLMQS